MKWSGKFRFPCETEEKKYRDGYIWLHFCDAASRTMPFVGELEVYYENENGDFENIGQFQGNPEAPFFEIKRKLGEFGEEIVPILRKMASLWLGGPELRGEQKREFYSLGNKILEIAKRYPWPEKSKIVSDGVLHWNE